MLKYMESKNQSSYPTIIKFFIREEPYGFLSNFERTGFEAESWGEKYWYPTNEHYYQSQKANNKRDHDDIVGLSRATQAMELGRAYDHGKYLKKYCKDNWKEEHADKVMLKGTRLKYKDPRLRKLLLETGNAILHENNPTDFYWAIADGTGKTMLGKIIMQVREEIRNEL